jgi:hypothetical protein
LNKVAFFIEQIGLHHWTNRLWSSNKSCIIFLRNTLVDAVNNYLFKN